MISYGNLTEKIQNNPENRGWFFGQFMLPGDFFYSTDFELKWGIHKAGEIRKKSKTLEHGKTIQIFIQGKNILSFPESGERFLLEKTGDFVTFDTQKTEHIFEALEDCTILTIRFPSVPYNPIP